MKACRGGCGFARTTSRNKIFIHTGPAVHPGPFFTTGVTVKIHKQLFILFIIQLVFLTAGQSLHAQTLAEKVREFKLDNGLKVLVVERHDSPTFSAQLSIGVGAVNETNRCRGVAHLLEHMLFKGTKTVGTSDYKAEKALLDRIEETGSRLDALKSDPLADPGEKALLTEKLKSLQEEHKKYVVKDEAARIYAENGGVGFNAFTSRDMTSYVVSLPSNKLELWAFLESDRMKNAVLREFYTEREVIMEERRRTYESNPQGLLMENLMATAFTVHPYRNPIIGWNSDIANLTLEETRRFHEMYYAPVNTVISLVGDLDAEQAFATVKRYFGDIAPGTPVPMVTDIEPRQRGEKQVMINFDAEPQLMIAYHKPTLPAPEDYAFDLIDLILSGGRTSRLYRSLVVEKKLATSVSTYGLPGARYANLFVVSAMPRHPHTAKEVESAIYAELERLAKEEVAPAEMEKVRNRLRIDRLRQMKNNRGLARMLAYFQSVAGDWRYATNYDREIMKISGTDVKTIAATYLIPENRTVAVVGKEHP
ncbi:MAG: insulinase family protein [Deltaproteobacteria bacterium]|nr:insulinase family protein [Deltaproteobacteria bacterium]